MSHRLDFATLSATGIHELKNLVGELTLLLDGLEATAAPQQRPPLSAARFLCGRIHDRMAALLTLYKLDGGRQAFAKEAHCPADVVEDIAAELRTLAGRPLQIDTEMAVDLPAFWFFDRELVRAALLNAGHNALLYARERVRLTAAQEAGWLVFTVADDGAGYPAELLADKPIEPQKSRHGSGLGLYLAQAVAHAHEHGGRRGRVRLRNGDDGGAVFALMLP
jgi:K+-sensing histidine kinase KdpD